MRLPVPKSLLYLPISSVSTQELIVFGEGIQDGPISIISWQGHPISLPHAPTVDINRLGTGGRDRAPLYGRKGKSTSWRALSLPIPSGGMIDRQGGRYIGWPYFYNLLVGPSYIPSPLSLPPYLSIIPLISLKSILIIPSKKPINEIIYLKYY